MSDSRAASTLAHMPGASAPQETLGQGGGALEQRGAAVALGLLEAAVAAENPERTPEETLWILGQAAGLNRLLGREDGELEAWRRAFEACPASARAACMYAETLVRMGRDFEAIEVVEALLGHHAARLSRQERVALYLRVGALYERHRQPRKARGVLVQALSLAPGHPEVLGRLLALAAPRAHAQSLRETRRLLAAMLEAPAARAQALVVLGDVVLGQWADERSARETYRWALAEDPDCVQAQQRLGPSPDAPASVLLGEEAGIQRSGMGNHGEPAPLDAAAECIAPPVAQVPQTCLASGAGGALASHEVGEAPAAGVGAQAAEPGAWSPGQARVEDTVPLRVAPSWPAVEVSLSSATLSGSPSSQAPWGMEEGALSRALAVVLAFCLGVLVMHGLPLATPLVPTLWAELPSPQRGFRAVMPERDVAPVPPAVAALPVVAALPAMVPDRPGSSPASLAPARIPCGAQASLTDDAPTQQGDCVEVDAEQQAVREAQRARRQAVLPRVQEAVARRPRPLALIENPCLEPDPERGGCRRRALDATFEGLLELLEQRRAESVRIGLWGDSLVAGDVIADGLRTRLAPMFGHGGQGFIHPGVADRPFYQRLVNVRRAGSWDYLSVTRHRQQDALMGYAGVSFTASPTAEVRVQRALSEGGIERLGVMVRRAANASAVRVATPGEGARQVALGGEVGQEHVEWLEFSPPVEWVRLSGFARGEVLTGLLHETAQPAVVVDNLGLVSSRAQALGRIGSEHWAGQIEKRGTNLMMFFYGANDAWQDVPGAQRMARYRDQYAEVIGRAGPGPQRNCLVMSILTRGERRQNQIHTYRSVQVIHDAQRAAAEQAGCAFWSAYAAIGGSKGAQRWSNAQPKLLGADLVHPTPAGSDQLAALFHDALMVAFLGWLEGA